jgi:site-specific DNA recombinase
MLTMRALIYVRVSTDEQADKGLSLPAQEEACLEYIKLKHLTIDPKKDVYIDAGESAKTANRPALQEMLSRCKKDKEVKVVLVHKLDRLARNVGDHAAIKTILRKFDIQLCSVVEPVDDSPTGALLENIMASVAEFYSANLGQEVKKGMKQVLKQGRYPGRAPVGYLNKDLIELDGTITKTIIKDSVKAESIQQAFRMFATNQFSQSLLCDELNKNGFKTFFNKGIKPTRLHGLLSNKFYMGAVVWGEEEVQGTHEPLVSPELFYRVQDVLRIRTKNTTRQKKALFSLRGSLYCAKCDRKYVAETHKGGRFSYYRCSSASRYGLHCDQKMAPEKALLEQMLDILKKVKLPEDIVTLAKMQVKKMEEQRVSGVTNERRHLREKISQLEEKQQRLLDDRLEGLIDKELCYEKMSKIKREIDLANVRLNEIEQEDNANFLALNKTIDVLGNIHEIYKMSDPPRRTLYNRSFFEKVIVDQKRITEIKWRTPFKALYRDKHDSGLPPYGAPGGNRTPITSSEATCFIH